MVDRDLKEALLMNLPTRSFSMAVAGLLLLAPVAPAATVLSNAQLKCQAGIAKAGGKFVKAVLKERAKCADKNLAATGSCDFAGRDAKLGKIESKLRSNLQKACVKRFPPTFDDEKLAALGFPSQCADGDPANGFTGEDLKDCMVDTHDAAATAIYDSGYGSNGADGVLDFETRDPANGRDLARCQKTIGRKSRQFAQKAQKELAKCRDGLLKGKLTGFLAEDCGNTPIHPKTGLKIDRARSSARASILSACADPVLQNPAMDVCDMGGGPQTDPVVAADCLLDGVRAIVDDLIEIEYAAVSPVCGDDVVNDRAVPQAFASQFFLGEPAEECDGTADSACPGKCGAPASDFPCLCTDVLRARVIEHANADLDNGWSGGEHDAAVGGGSYVVDLYDCDGPGGPDVLCTVGPSCALAPHAPCLADADCPGGGNFCRKTALATDPHCQVDAQVACYDKVDCTGGSGDFCRKSPHGIPVPLVSGGLSVCVVNVFSEAVVGTMNLATGATTVRLRHNAVAHLATGTLACPSCGGFCAGVSDLMGAGTRTRCASDADCPASVACVLDAICSHGANEDQPCRPDLPFGNAVPPFGNPSLDCPPPIGSNIGAGLDILLNPLTTGTQTTLPSVPCNAPGFAGNKCLSGTEVGKACGADSDCAGGGVGSCAPQCFCTGGGGTVQKPNDCFPACHGGGNDYEPCAVDTDCPGGVCETASCRIATGVCTGGSSIGTSCSADSDCSGGPCGDADSSGEGFCPAGPIVGHCSATTFQDCFDDTDCRPSGSCPFCQSDDSEVCAFRATNCFPSAGYTRIGQSGVPDRVEVAHFCLPPTGNASVDALRGLPGPGALEQPTSLVVTSP